MSVTEESHQIRLLEDALADSEIGRTKRDESWAATLGAVRQRRGFIQRRRRLRAATAAAAVSLVVVATIWFLAPPRVPVAESGPGRHPGLERANPLEIVRSSAIAPAMRVRTLSDGFVGVRSRPMAFPNVHTGDFRPPAVVDDAALFGLLAGRPAAIVRYSGVPAQLLILDEL